MTRKRKGADRRKQRDQFERKRQPQHGLVLVELLCIAAIFAVIVLYGFVAFDNRRDFATACDKIGGDTVFDGRQYQCLKKKPQE